MAKKILTVTKKVAKKVVKDKVDGKKTSKKQEKKIVKETPNNKNKKDKHTLVVHKGKPIPKKDKKEKLKEEPKNKKKKMKLLGFFKKSKPSKSEASSPNDGSKAPSDTTVTSANINSNGNIETPIAVKLTENTNVTAPPEVPITIVDVTELPTPEIISDTTKVADEPVERSEDALHIYPSKQISIYGDVDFLNGAIKLMAGIKIIRQEPLVYEFSSINSNPQNYVCDDITQADLLWTELLKYENEQTNGTPIETVKEEAPVEIISESIDTNSVLEGEAAIFENQTKEILLRFVKLKINLTKAEINDNATKFFSPRFNFEINYEDQGCFLIVSDNKGISTRCPKNATEFFTVQ